MIIYTRNIDRKLISLRSLFVALCIICLYAFPNNFLNLGYFISILLILLSIVVVKNFIIFTDSFQITKFYFFGLIKRKWQFERGENIQIKSYGSDFGQEGEVPDFGDSETGVGCLFYIISIFNPPKITYKEFTIQVLGKAGALKRVQILLNQEEYNLLETFINKPHSTLSKLST